MEGIWKVMEKQHENCSCDNIESSWRVNKQLKLEKNGAKKI